MRFAIQQLRINNTLVPGAQGYQLDRGLEVNSDGSDGTVYETAHHVIQAKPAVDLTLLDLAGLISLFTGSSDLPLLELDGTNGIEMWGAKGKPKRTGYDTSGHQRRRAKNGVLAMTGLRWSPGQKATVSVKGWLTSPNGIDPVIEQAAVALPATPTPDLGFALTAATVAGQQITAINSLDLSIDPKLDHEFSLGLPQPVDVFGAGVRGKLAVTARLDIGDLDLGEGTGATSFVFTKYAHGGGFAAKTVTFTLNSVWSSTESDGGQNGQPMTNQLLIRTRHDGTNRQLAWSQSA